MLPDLEKICTADRQAREALTRAQKEAQALLEAAQAEVEANRAELQNKLAQLERTIREETLKQAEARAAGTVAAAKTYIQVLQEKRQAHGEEAVALLVSWVLAG